MIRMTSMYPESRDFPRAGHSHGPVDDKGVHIVQLKVLQGCHQVGTNMLGAVVGVPQFGLEEE